jgi:hypothetical protein
MLRTELGLALDKQGVRELGRAGSVTAKSEFDRELPTGPNRLGMGSAQESILVLGNILKASDSSVAVA